MVAAVLGRLHQPRSNSQLGSRKAVNQCVRAVSILPLLFMSITVPKFLRYATCYQGV